MGKYVRVIKDDNTTSTQNNVQVYSTHCLQGQHDYGYSDRCACPCHSNNFSIATTSATFF